MPANVGIEPGVKSPMHTHRHERGDLTRRQMSGQAVAAVVAERATEAGLGHIGPEDLRRAYLAAQS